MQIPFINTAKAAPKKFTLGGFGPARTVASTTPKASALTKKVLPNGNAQTNKVGKAMASAFKNQKTFGIPGAK